MSYNSSCGYCSTPVSGGCGMNYSSVSSLESAVMEYSPAVRMYEEAGPEEGVMRASVEDAQINMDGYELSGKKRYTEGMYLNKANSQGYYFTPEVFLNNIPTEFVSCGDEKQKEAVKALVEEAFEATTGKKIPGDVAIRICSEKELREIHEANGGLWNPGISGFSINRKGFGVSGIFAKENELARLMLTIGHEIGHVMTFPMKNAVDEEAKAFAFSMAWMKKIKEHNIGGLSDAVNPSPAKNGLHNVAFDFVADLIRKGMEAIDVYLEMIKGKISIKNAIPIDGGR